jgi:hypothetical protein
MAEENFEDDNDDFNTPHLPERYHQTVRAKKQQRLKKRILMAVAAIIVIVVLYSLISWAAGGLLQGRPPRYHPLPHQPRPFRQQPRPWLLRLPAAPPSRRGGAR